MSLCAKCHTPLAPTNTHKQCESCLRKSAVRGRRHYAKKKAAADGSMCSSCGKLRDDPTKKKCSSCLQYMREYKKAYRQRIKPAGICTGSDCQNPVEGGFKHCASCRARAREAQKKPHRKATVREHHALLKVEVLAAYGGKCACCGETRQEFLSINHAGGYVSGPRKGWQLYSSLRQRQYPSGYRVLCMSCNFALGHHGYCPHGSLTQECRVGRPRIYAESSEKHKAQRRQWMIDTYKLPAMHAYGGPRCACCGETHLECLQLDHTNGNGAEHRRENPKAKNIYIWLKQRGYPPGYRVLCTNCNFSMGHAGYCPHQRERLEVR